MATEMKLITDITLELTGETKRYEVVAKQGDKATRFIRITLKNNGQDFEIPAGMKVIANIQKPDRKCCYNTCSYSGSTVTMELTNQALAVAGTAECDIEIRDANDEVVLSSQAFTIEIEKSMRDENAIRSSNEFTQLEQDVREYAAEYLEKNPVQPTPVDKTLTKENEAAEAKIVGEEITRLSHAVGNAVEIEELNFTKVYAATPGYFEGHGSYSTQDLNISGFKRVYAESKVSRICWYGYKIEGELTYVTDIWLNASQIKNNEGKYVFDLDLAELERVNADTICIGFYGQNFDESAQTIIFYSNEEQDKYVSNNIIEKKRKLVDTLYSKNSGYSGDLFELVGANINWYAGADGEGYIDVSSEKTLYIKIPYKGFVNLGVPGFYCFDTNKEPLYPSNNSESEIISSEYGSINGKPSENGNPAEYVGISDDGTNITRISLCEITFPEEVKWVAFIPNLTNGIFENQTLLTDSLFIIGREKIDDYYQKYDDYITQPTERFENLVRGISGEKEETSSKYYVIFIGDSLTNWGGGNDGSDGFLKIVHEKTGVLTVNQGYAGATWQNGEGQTYSGVQRIDTLISSGTKYDMYVFILGTNGGSQSDTGETSSDTSTMPGAIRYCMEKLKMYDPTSKILVCLPPQRAEGNESQEKVNEVIKNIANSYSVKTLDLFHECGIVSNTKIPEIGYLSDGLHLDKKGIKLMGDILSSEIKYLLCI